MRYITVRNGGYILYIEQSTLQEIVENPRIHRIPGAPGNIAGLSYYKGEPVIYYQMLLSADSAVEKYRCGMIVRCGREIVGIAGEIAGEEETVPEEAEPFMQGVWVMKSD